MEPNGPWHGRDVNPEFTYQTKLKGSASGQKERGNKMELTDEMITEMAQEAVANAKDETARAVKEEAAETEAAGETKEETTAQTADGKTYSTKVHKGYSKKQMHYVYGQAKNRMLFIAKPVLEKMYAWADSYAAEADPVIEDLRQAACKAVDCVFLKNFKAAQSKVRYIESVLKKLNNEKAA